MKRYILAALMTAALALLVSACQMPSSLGGNVNCQHNNGQTHCSGNYGQSPGSGKKDTDPNSTG